MLPIKVAIVEDDLEFRSRFSSIVEASGSLVLAGAVATAKEGYALIDRSAADVYLVDLGLPDENGIGLIHHIAKYQPSAHAMVVTVFGDDAHVIRSIQAGAAGYLLKDALPGEMVDCIVELHNGGSPMSPTIARSLLRLFRSASPPPAPALETPLSEREMEILTVVAKGLTFIEIGESLAISPHTVRNHVQNIYQKLSVHSRGEAVFEARQMGLLR